MINNTEFTRIASSLYHSVEDISNYRERIFSRIPEMYGKVEAGSAVYQIVDSIAYEMHSENYKIKELVASLQQVCFAMNALCTEINNNTPIFNDEGIDYEIDSKIDKRFEDKLDNLEDRVAKLANEYIESRVKLELDDIKKTMKEHVRNLDDEARSEFMKELESL
jgi:hypothetical protein